MLLAALTALLVATPDAPLFIFQDERIAESSSLVAASSGDLLYTANDSGDTARVFTVDRSGRTTAVHDLPGVEPEDVEDAGLGPGPTLYLADTGDNRAQRRSVAVLAVPEPTAGAAPQPRTTTLTYEDGAHDAEALLVHPRTGQLLVVTKNLLGSGVYAAPQPLADGVLRRVASVRPEVTGTAGGPQPQTAAQLLVTGGAVSPDGRRLVVRTYTDAYVYDVPGEDLVDAFTGAPQVLPLPATAQGEAVTWTRDGKALLTSSEGVGAPVHRVPVPARKAAGRTSSARATSPAASPRSRQAPTSEEDGAPLLPLAVLGGLLLGAALLLRRRRTHG